MCRMAYFVGDKDGRNYNAVLSSFIEMDHFNGGGGMGVAMLEDGKVAVVTKAVALNAQDCATMIVNRPDGAAAIWHTRAATVGDRHDQRCHPFYMTRKLNNGKTQELVLAHNGTMHEWYILSKVLKFPCWNDSHLLTRMLLFDFSLPTIVLRGGALLAARRVVNKDGTSSPWKHYCMRVTMQGDLIGFADGGVVSMPAEFDDTNDSDVPTGRWINLRPGKTPPQTTPTYNVATYWDEGSHQWRPIGDRGSQSQDTRADTNSCASSSKTRIIGGRADYKVINVEEDWWPLGQSTILRIHLDRVDDAGVTKHELTFRIDGNIEFVMIGKKKELLGVFKEFAESTPHARIDLFSDWKEWHKGEIAKRAVKAP